jgi:Ca-activated chloride channel homolog
MMQNQVNTFENGLQDFKSWLINFMMISYIVLISSFSGSLSHLHAQVQEDADKTLSPYFFIQSDDPALDQLPLKSTSADVNIAGVIADVRVTQVYKNEGKKTLEAIYIFPASTRAAVYSMKMTIGERTIIAKIEEREKARQQYEQAKQEGRSASLLEQQRPNVFQMNVANILPGDVIKVELSYTEILIPVEKQYEFVYPTVVGPRYSNKTSENASDQDNWIENPYLNENTKPNYDFNIDVTLNGGVPIQKIVSSSHLIQTNYTGKNSVKISLDGSEKKGGNKDFILRYQLAGKKIQTGLMLFENENEKFFLTMIQPPERVSNEEIVAREYIFIIDISGSMNGFPISITKDLMRSLLGNLNSTDKFNVLLFAGGSKLFSQASVSANESNISKAIYMIDNEPGAGGTQLLPALKRAMDLPSSEGFSKSIVIVTDGYVSVEREAFDLIRNKLGHANVFTFGIGSSVNRFLIEGLARAGKGDAFVITKNSEAAGKADKFRTYIQSPVMTDIKISLDGFNAYAYEPHIPDVFADRPILIFGKYKNRPSGEIIITGRSGSENYKTRIDISDFDPDQKNQALKYLWARDRVALIADYISVGKNEELIQEITSLGLQYNILTEYTSFVAIDSERRNKNGELTTVKQPLPLPQGVNNMAIGALGRTGYAGSASMKSRGVLAPESIQAEDASIEMLAQVEIIKIKASESDVKQTIESFFEKQKSFFEYCYMHRIKQLNGTNPEGKLSLKITLSANGKIKDIKIISDSLNDTKITECLVKKLRQLSISGINKNKIITVDLDLKFSI